MDEFSKKTLVMVLSGGKGERLYPLTRDRAKPSVPFCATYRIIDFSLSNAYNSGLHKIALLTQYKSLSLERHIQRGWNIFHPESGGFIISLPAQGRLSDHWYEGTADAVFQNIYSIQQENPDYVLVLSGDHIYRSDYRKVFAFLREREADAVILARPVPIADGSRFGIIGADADHRVVEFLEKPKKPFPTPWDPQSALASMGVYLFKTSVLVKALLRDARNPQSSHDFGKNILPLLMKDFRLLIYPFEGYWEDIGTVDAYWKANMAFLGAEPPVALADPDWPIHTHKPLYPPTYVRDGEIRNSIIAAGGCFSGCKIENSIVSFGVTVGDDAEVRDSILLEGVEVRPGARVQRTIVDKRSTIPDHLRIGYDAEEDGRHFKISRDGVRVVPKGWVVA